MDKLDQKKNISSQKAGRQGVTFCQITEDQEGQRIDNFLTTKLKGMPKSRIYRLLRKGEVRVNKKRIDASYRLVAGDEVRLPPMFLMQKGEVAPPSQATTSHLADRILYEDEYLIVLNKPSGMAVHAGSTIRMGVIEALRHHFHPKYPQLELAHRLDTETSGCLILAKKKKVLRELHEALREGRVTKIYWALTKGVWKPHDLKVDVPLHKEYRDGGKHVVRATEQGKSALTYFKPLETFGKTATLVEVRLMTGRTHQIRVHADYKGHPLAMDDRYGEAEFNKLAKQLGLKRLFLHAHSIEFSLPSLPLPIKVEAPLDNDLESALRAFRKLSGKNEKRGIDD